MGKTTAKEVIFETIFCGGANRKIAICPNCSHILNNTENSEFCKKCGQLLIWEINHYDSHL